MTEPNKTASKHIEKAREMAKEGLYDDVVYLGSWRLYKVYMPIRNEFAYTGFPQYIYFTDGVNIDG